MKRVVGFFDMFDTIPDSAKYLFSNKIEFTVPEIEEEKTHKIISNNPSEAHENNKAIIFIHYYEVDTDKFDELNDTTGFLKKSNLERMREFMHQYKIPMK